MKMQIFAMYTDAEGSGFRHLVETPFTPLYLTMSPDGEQLMFFAQETLKPYAVQWDGGNFRELPLPGTDSNRASANCTSQFSWDGRWLNYFSGGGPQITQLDGTGRFEPFHGGHPNAWAAYPDGFFNDVFMADFTRDLRRFVFVSQVGYRQRPRQLIVADLNPDASLTKDLPKITEVTFPNRLSTDATLPNHIGSITAKVIPGAEKVEYMHSFILPVVQATGDPNRPWDWDRGWNGLEGDHILRDDGDPKRGDTAAGDGVWSGQVIPHYYNKPLPGKYPVRIVAHTPKTAVIVDVDGANIK
jgi:hypothetical protein